MIGRIYLLRGERWRCIARGEPFDRGPRRNVLLERLSDGYRIVRPFRGLRRAAGGVSSAFQPGRNG